MEEGKDSSESRDQSTTAGQKLENMTKQRSVIQTLDLPDDFGEYDHFTPGNCGWLSPRRSFSADSQPGEKEIMSPEGSCCSTNSRLSRDDGSSTSAEFEFAMATSTFPNSLSEDFYMSTADELFHGGKLLPGYITPDGKKELLIVDPFLVAQAAERTPVTIARHVSAEGFMESSSPAPIPPRMGCVIGSVDCPRNATPKPPKWRELFGALRRVKSDSGRQRIDPEETTLLPPKAAGMQGRKKFFKHFFSHGQNNAATSHDQESTVKMSTIFSPIPPPRSCTPSSASSSSSVTFIHPLTSTCTHIPPPLASSSSSFSFDHKETNNAAINPPTSAEVLAAETSYRRGSNGSDIFLAEPAAYGRSKCSIASSATTTIQNARGKLGSSAGVPARKVERPNVAGPSLMRSASGRVIVRSLDRAGSGINSSVKNPATLQEHIRALSSNYQSSRVAEQPRALKGHKFNPQIAGAEITDGRSIHERKRKFLGSRRATLEFDTFGRPSRTCAMRITASPGQKRFSIDPSILAKKQEAADDAVKLTRWQPKLTAYQKRRA
ncbi:hypothetical protein R1flu_002749 [Riccia fluitans]|uniref:Uncharacterized protein n=1 Tax=Riccia fluitans TaxID=41844 RepID=A0ABD1Y713_9MARC